MGLEDSRKPNSSDSGRTTAALAELRRCRFDPLSVRFALSERQEGCRCKNEVDLRGLEPLPEDGRCIRSLQLRGDRAGHDSARPVLATGQCGALVTAITVDWALDPDSTSSTDTCSYTQGGLFSPDSDGRCTIRRALREASARPAVDRLIVIKFMGLTTGGAGCTDGSQDSCDDGQYDTTNDQWRLKVDGNSNRGPGSGLWSAHDHHERLVGDLTPFWVALRFQGERLPSGPILRSYAGLAVAAI